MNHYYVKLTHLFSELQDHNFQYRPVVTSQPDRNGIILQSRQGHIDFYVRVVRVILSPE